MGSILRKGLFLVTFSGAALALPATAQASDTAADPVMPSVGIEEVLSDCYSSGQEIDASDYLVPTEKGEYLDMAFATWIHFCISEVSPRSRAPGLASCTRITRRRSPALWMSGRRSSPALWKDMCIPTTL